MEKREATVAAAVREDPSVVRVLAGEDRGAGRAAERVRDEVVREGRPLLLHLADVRHVLDEVPGEVVREDEDDVRPRLRRLPLGGRSVRAREAADESDDERDE